jgi:hypothetical protein
MDVFSVVRYDVLENILRRTGDMRKFRHGDMSANMTSYVVVAFFSSQPSKEDGSLC